MQVRFLVVFLFLFSSQLQAQVLPAFGGSRSGTTGMQFLKIGVDARSAGLSGNYISVGNDLSAVFWNPAGITNLDTQRVHTLFGHTLYFSNVGISYGAIAKKYKESYFAFSLVSLNSGRMEVTTEFQPLGTGQYFTVNDITAGLTFAKKLTDNFSFGVTGKYARESIAGLVNHNGVIDFGFLYDIGFKNTRFGVTINNFGFNSSFKGSTQKQTLTGIDTASNFQEVSIPTVFRIGFAWDPIKTHRHTLTLNTQLNHPTDNNETIGFGAEYLFLGILYTRMGYEFGVDEYGLPAFGFGLKTQRNFGIMRIDYGYNNKARLGAVHRFTVGISLF